jgi:hypothetical protein
MEETKDLIIDEIEQLAGINARQLFDKGLLTLEHARKWIVKHKYFQLAKTGRTYTDIKYELSLDYGISVSSIEKMVYRK